jgi:Tol biopolymer transport system component
MAVFGAALMLFTGVQPALATFEGRNGRIAFRRYLNERQTRGALFTIRRDGAGLQQITHPRRGIVTDEPDWSPNGRWIVYQVEKKSGFSRLFKIRANGSNRTYLSTGCGRICGDGYASWFPGGKRLALQRGSCGTRNTLFAIYVMRANGTKARRVTHKGATCDTRHRYEDSAPGVAPSGKRLAFERVDHKRGKHAVFTVRLDGTGRRRVTPWRIDASQPDWSPNGRWIAFRTQEQSETRGNIALVHPNGKGLHRITNSRGEHKWLSCSFAPNGKKIQAGRFPGRGKAGNADIYVMNLDGSGRRNVTKSSRWESASDWGPRRRG